MMLTLRVLCIASALVGADPSSADVVKAEPIPLACVADALSAKERKHSEWLREQITGAIEKTRERDDGLDVTLRGNSLVLAHVAAWICLERRCCPFLSYKLDWKSGEASPSLAITGPPGVKEFLREELPKLGASSKPRVGHARE
jgi:hypothetical protein